jgi:hypothetical protein
VFRSLLSLTAHRLTMQPEDHSKNGGNKGPGREWVSEVGHYVEASVRRELVSEGHKLISAAFSVKQEWPVTCMLEKSGGSYEHS